MSFELFTEAVADAKAAVARLEAVGASLFGQAEGDAVKVAETAATSGLDAAGVEAVGDAAKLATTAVADVTAGAPVAPSTPASAVADVTTPPTV